MATVKEERARLQFFEEHGRGDEKVHVVFVEQDAKERVANKKEKTRFVMETDSPLIYSRMNAARDKLFARLNKAVALEIMTKRWEMTEAKMDELAKGEEPEIEREALDLLRAAKDLFEEDADCQTVESDAWVWLKRTEMFLERYDPELEIETGCLGDA